MNTPTHVEGFLSEDPVSARALSYDSPLKRTLVGTAFIGAAGAAAFGMHEYGQNEERVAVSMPFVQEVQTGVSRIDGVLGEIGKYGLLVSLGTIGAYKIGARWSPTMRAIDKASSKEMTNDGNHNPGLARRALRSTFAGNVPVIASVGVALGTFTAAIGAEVSEGPSRPIAAFDNIAPGESMVVQYEGAMPMVQSNINNQLSKAVQIEAAKRDVRATPVDLNLGTMTTASGESFSDLSVGVPMPPGAVADWQPEMGCTEIPVLIDKSARLDNDTRVDLNGVSARVAGSIENTSAINRVGILMDAEALKTCLEQSPESGDHAIVLDTEPATAKEILAAANNELTAPAAVITKEAYTENSKEFWTSNVKPITNVLALAAMGAVLISLGGSLGARILRNRRELALDLARGISANKMRAIELLRSTKDGVAASAIGVAAAAAITPAANMIVAGFHAGVGIKEATVGVGVGILGSNAGAIGKLTNLREFVNVKENTR